MAFSVIDSSVLPVTVAAGDNAYVGKDVSIVVGAPEDALTLLNVTSTTTRIINDGTVVSVGGNGMFLVSDNLFFANGATGIIRGFDNGIVLVSNVGLTTNPAGMVNHGSIIGALAGISVGIKVASEVKTAVGVSFINTGLISGGKFGFDSWFGGGTTLANSGVISGNTGVRMSYFGELTNTGDILGTGIGVKTSYRADINNSGVISGDIGIKVTSGLWLDNTGIIESHASGRWLKDLAIDGWKSDELVLIQNSGTINGGISASNFLRNAGHPSRTGDTVENAGTINGYVGLNAGDDVYVGVGAGIVTGAVYGGSGKDKLTGGSAADSFEGGTGADLLRGRAGDDTLKGGSGNDVVKGGSGDDDLFGGRGNDILIGGSGDNLFVGGAGSDQMRAGSGTDTFVWKSAAESGLNAARDKVYGFETGTDMLDLSAVAPDTIAFLGTAGFTSGGTAELRLVEKRGVTTLIEVDVDGDGIADMQIQIMGTVGLTESDFLL